MKARYKTINKWIVCYKLKGSAKWRVTDLFDSEVEAKAWDPYFEVLDIQIIPITIKERQ